MKKKPVKLQRSKPTPARKKSIAKKVPKATSKFSRQAITLELKRIDKELIKLANRRAELTTKVIEKQPNPHHAVFDIHQDEALWQELETMNSGPLPFHAIRGVYREILSAARHKVRSVRVAYLGPSYSFSHVAAIERFGNSADLIPVSTIATVFEEVNRGHANFGVVPIENSTDGRIVDTLDMFTRLPLRICGEVQLAIHHHLLASVPRGEIVEVYSKPQALSQCREWLARNMPQAQLREVTSTSTAAQLARDKPGAAAIASTQAAVQYGLQTVAERIEDNSNNITRFAVIGDEAAQPTGIDRTAVLLQIPHKPGALADSLSVFKKNKINLTWIESFPLKGPELGYLFFIDFEGHFREAKIKKAISEMERHAVRLEVLGSYPRSEPIE
ncbi:MAG: prephenate dehydratase [Planctomycetaceae bacterium]